MSISLTVEFGGGLEILFSNTRSHKINIPSSVQDGQSPNLLFLIEHLRTNLLKEREELFIEDATVRPGILVLINDTDWELEGEGNYILKDGDQIVFISTLHGG